MAKNQAKLLKERAEKFYFYADQAFKNEDFEIAAFNFEQSAQLYLKYTLSLLIGDFPKTHELRKLMKELMKITKSKELSKLLNEQQSVISDLETAYLTSRYLPATFYKKQVENMRNFVDELKEILKNLWT
jgi:HEPN domain-containing protein